MRLERCLETRRRQDLGLQRCPMCGAVSPPELGRCGHCGRYLKVRRELMDALTTALMLRIWRWLMVLLLVAGVAEVVLAPGEPIVGMACLALAGCVMLIFVYGRMRGPGR